MVDDGYLSLLEGLSMKGLLAYWIHLEDDKASFYEKLADRVQELNVDTAFHDMFNLLSQEARRHGRKLRELYTKKFGDTIPGVQGPSLEDLTGVVELESESDVLGSLEGALRLEILAEKVYSILEEKSDDEFMRAVFSYLGSTERLHERALRALIDDGSYQNGVKERAEA